MVFVESRGSLLSSCICHKLQNHSSIFLLSYFFPTAAMYIHPSLNVLMLMGDPLNNVKKKSKKKESASSTNNMTCPEHVLQH